uniref:Uncharacterized protein n=1 Tax=Proteus mirabilis TaxID=584 RepID=A0A346FVJ5_PROMI|nr:Hypothetical protein [Proteus mirabilis]
MASKLAKVTLIKTTHQFGETPLSFSKKTDIKRCHFANHVMPELTLSHKNRSNLRDFSMKRL